MSLILLVGAAVLAVVGVLLLAAMIRMPGRSHAGALPSLSTGEQALRDRLVRHVNRLAGEIGERNLWRPDGLRQASRYLRDTLEAAGYAVQVQAFQVEGETVENVVAERRGSRQAGEIVVVGAHYDSVVGCPGANDNASGVAAMLELAAAFAGQTPDRTVRFIGFVNEEPPFFQTARMGSLQYARRAAERGDHIVAMISIETIGAYSDAPGSQAFPLPLFGRLYPDTANFIVFVGRFSTRRLVRQAIGAFRRATAFPSEGAALPAGVPGVAWSDHWAFWQAGYPAIMITDTALYRYAPYHTAGDTPDRIDYDRMARVVAGLMHVVTDLTAGEGARP